MRTIVIIILIQSFLTGSCQTAKLPTRTLADKTSTEAKVLKKEGVKNYLILERACDGCEIKNANGCDCMNGGIMAAYLYFQKNDSVYKREIKCCEPAETKNIPASFFDSIQVMANKIKRLEKEQTGKFYPPVATDQSYYKIIVKSPEANIEFALYDDQLKAGTEENKGWSVFSAFAAQKQMLLYLLKINEHKPINQSSIDEVVMEYLSTVKGLPTPTLEITRKSKRRTIREANFYTEPYDSVQSSSGKITAYIFGSGTTHTRKYYLLEADVNNAAQYKIIDDATLEGAIASLLTFLKPFELRDAEKAVLIRGLTFVYN